MLSSTGLKQPITARITGHVIKPANRIEAGKSRDAVQPMGAEMLLYVGNSIHGRIRDRS